MELLGVYAMIPTLAESNLHRLCAELAASCRRRYVAEALRAGLRRRRWRCRRVEFLKQILRRQHQEEVHHGRNQKEVDDRCEKRPIFDLATVHIRHEVVEVWLADDRSQQRVDDIGGQSGDDRSERSADNYGDSQIHHVTAQDEIAKSL